MEVVRLRDGVSVGEAREAARWMAKAFAQAPAEPALAVMFGTSSYEENVEMHEAFWAAHINRVARSGILLGVKEEARWRGFRCLFPPGQGRQPYDPDFEDGSNTDWNRFLELTGRDAYMGRLSQWSRLTKATHDRLELDTGSCFTTSVIVVDPEHQRRGIGRLLDTATREIASNAGSKLFLRTHDHVLPFYNTQGYQILASPSYAVGQVDPFVVHFLIHVCHG